MLRELSTDKGEAKRKGQEGEVWEDAVARRERKRAEGLARRSEAARKEPEEKEGGESEDAEVVGFGGVLDGEGRP